MRLALALVSLLACIAISTTARADQQFAKQGPYGSYGGVVACNQTALYGASTSGATQIVAAIAGKTIYVCGFQIVSGGTVAIGLTQGTGTNCGTGTSNVTPQFSTTAQNVITDDSPFWRGMSTNPGYALCFNASSGVAATAVVYYTQF